MGQKHYLGLDVGTQSVKGLIFDPESDGSVIARAGKPLDLLSGLPAGAAEQHPDDWWQAVIEVIQELFHVVGLVVQFRPDHVRLHLNGGVPDVHEGRGTKPENLG